MVTDIIIKKGYKQTELGVIPEDWDVKILKDLNFDISDGNYSSKYPKSEDFKLFGTPFIRANNIYNLKVIDDDMRYISVFQHRELLKGHLKQGDILITTRGDIGQVAIVPDIHIDSNINAQIVRVNTKKHFNNLYLAYFITSNCGQNQVKNLQTGSALKQLPVGRLMQLKVITPSKPEQTAIATVLSDTDALIEHLEKLIAKKKAIKQGTMQQLLTSKNRLPGFSGEWEVKKLGEISEIKTGKKNNDDKVSDGIYPFFVRSQYVERINTYSFDGEAILIPGEGNIGNIYHYIDGRFDWHQRVYKISNFDEQYSGKFIYLSMSQHFNAHAMKNSVKATVDSLRLPTFKEFEISFPPTKSEQTAIATILSDMDIEIDRLKQKRNKYAMLKQGMMQQLLTGKIRIYANT